VFHSVTRPPWSLDIGSAFQTEPILSKLLVDSRSLDNVSVSKFCFYYKNDCRDLLNFSGAVEDMTSILWKPTSLIRDIFNT
jgi:hypothetical protein